jgi:hypothetical protein
MVWLLIMWYRSRLWVIGITLWQAPLPRLQRIVWDQA